MRIQVFIRPARLILPDMLIDLVFGNVSVLSVAHREFLSFAPTEDAITSDTQVAPWLWCLVRIAI